MSDEVQGSHGTREDVLCVEGREQCSETLEANLASDGSDQWTLDSACSHHYTYRIEGTGLVLFFLGRETAYALETITFLCKVEWIRSIRVQMHNDCVRVLSHVKLVPELKTHSKSTPTHLTLRLFVLWLNRMKALSEKLRSITPSEWLKKDVIKEAYFETQLSTRGEGNLSTSFTTSRLLEDS